MRRSKRLLGTTLLFAAAFGAAGGCGGSGGGGNGGPPPFLRGIPEVEPNDSAGMATALGGEAGVGSLAAPGDVDYWSFDASAGETIQIELFAARMDQRVWDQEDNVPQMTLVHPDGTTPLLWTDYGGILNPSGGWSWSKQDIDFMLYYVRTSGTYYVRLTQDDPTTAGGPYAVVARTVPLGTPQVEGEPRGSSGANDTAVTAEPLGQGVLRGWHVDGEDDYYAFTTAAPVLVYLDLSIYRNGVYEGDDDDVDPEMWLYDTDGTTLLTSNDDVYYYDSAIAYGLQTPGTYYVRVGECCGDGDGEYFLTYLTAPIPPLFEVEPNDTSGSSTNIAYGTTISGSAAFADVDWYAFSGQAGDMVRLWNYSGPNAEGSPAAVTAVFLAPDGTTALDSRFGPDLRVRSTILQQTGTHYVRVTAAANTAYTLQLQRFKRATYETEPNDTVAAPGALDGQGRAAGVVSGAGDVDVFRFAAEASEVVVLDVYATASGGSDGISELSDHGSSLQPLVQVWDATPVLLAESTFTPPLNDVYAEGVVNGLPVVTVVFVAPARGDYHVSVASASGGFGPSEYYVVERR